MKKNIWILYWVLITGVVLYGSFGIILNGKISLLSFIAMSFSIAMLVGLYGFIFREAILTRKFWVFIAWCVGISIFMQVMGLFFALSAGAVVILIVSIFQAPMYYAIFKYCSIENQIWSDSPQASKEYGAKE